MNPDLSQLRDIHLPADPSWWPLAPGWWILLGLTALIALAVWLVRRRRRVGRWRRIALAELERIRSNEHAKSPAARLRDLSVLLRRVAISRFPRTDVASLHGDAWLAFLDRPFGDEQLFRSDTGRVLAAGPYVDESKLAGGDLDGVFTLAEKWIRKLTGSRHSRARRSEAKAEMRPAR